MSIDEAELPELEAICAKKLEEVGRIADRANQVTHPSQLKIQCITLGQHGQFIIRKRPSTNIVKS